MTSSTLRHQDIDKPIYTTRKYSNNFRLSFGPFNQLNGNKHLHPASLQIPHWYDILAAGGSTRTIYATRVPPQVQHLVAGNNEGTDTDEIVTTPEGKDLPIYDQDLYLHLVNYSPPQAKKRLRSVKTVSTLNGL